MTKPLPPQGRLQSFGEEIANSVSSGIGLMAVIAGIPLLVGSAIQRRNEFSLAGAIVFAAAMVTLYLTSTIYHALPRGRIKRLFRLFDHSAIFLLIAGTYTPFALGALRGVWAWTLLGVLWGLAILGIGFKAFGGLKYRWLSILLYVCMGWMALFAIRLFWLRVGFQGLLRNRVLLGEASPVQPLDLAPFRERGNNLSFLRRPLVCRVGKAILIWAHRNRCTSPSDCIAIATQQRAPIYVSLDVWDEVRDMTEALREM